VYKSSQLALAVPPASLSSHNGSKVIVRTRLGPYAVTWNLTHLVQIGRPFRAGTPARGDGHSFPGLASSDDQFCEVYPFLNNTGSTDLVEVTQTEVSDLNAFFSAWLVFTPDDLMAHGPAYLGDAGVSYWPGELPRSFSFLVPARTAFVVVANSVDGTSRRGGTYTFTVSGTDLVASRPPADLRSLITDLPPERSSDQPRSSTIAAAVGRGETTRR
jgi:hypothetical protein